MLIQSWSDVFLLSLQSLWYGFVAVVPKILLAIIVFVIGWIIAGTLARLVTAGIDALKLDKMFANIGANDALARAGWRLHIGGVIGWLVKWLIVLAFFIASVNILGLMQVSAFLGDILSYIPNIIIAVLVLIAGTLVADLARKLVSGSAAVANIRSARMIGTIAYYAIWILAIVTALDKLGIFGYFGQILFSGLVFMLALALGLSFGLGGKEAAGRWVSKFSEDISGRQH
jgi:hypothetical protein